jgi:hypothetical protein
MKEKRSLVILGLFFLIQFPSYAHDPMNEASDFLKKINAKLWNRQQYKMELTYEYYKSKEDQEPQETERGYFNKDGIKRHALQFGIEVIQNKDERLVIDRNSETVILANTVRDTVVNPSLIDFTKFLQLSNEFEICWVNHNQVLSIKFPSKLQTGYSEIQLHADSNYLLNEVVLMHDLEKTSVGIYNYDDEYLNPMTKIKFVEYDLSPSFSASEFVFSNILNCTSDNNCQLSEAYSKYTFYNQKIKP